MKVEISHRVFVDHSQYYQGCAWPTVLGVGETPHDALADAISQAIQTADSEGIVPLDDAVAIVAALREYPCNEPDEVGELDKIEGWDADGSEVSWHCELTIEVTA